MKQIPPYAPKRGFSPEELAIARILELKFTYTCEEMKLVGARYGAGTEFTAQTCVAVLLRAAAEMTVGCDILKGEETDVADFAATALMHINLMNANMRGAPIAENVETRS